MAALLLSLGVALYCLFRSFDRAWARSQEGGADFNNNNNVTNSGHNESETAVVWTRGRRGRRDRRHSLTPVEEEAWIEFLV